MKIVICGQKAFGAAVFDLVRKFGYRIVAVWSPEKGAGGMDRLRARAELFEVPWHVAGTLSAETLPRDTDLIIAAHSHDFIGRRTRLQTRIGAIGYHPSLLPLHRGRDAVKWAVRLNERITGGSVYWLSDVTDGGPIAAQDWCFIRPGDTPTMLWERELFPMGLRLISGVLGDLSQGRLVAVPQDETIATWEPALQQPPLRRPDLLQIGSGRIGGLSILTESKHLHMNHEDADYPDDSAVAGLRSIF